MPLVDILLATYDGAAFLPDQLASLEAQTHRDWRLLLRDDGSSDGSAELVRAWGQRTGREVVVIEDGQTRLGPGRSFARLLARSDAPYFAFCDQDDVWHANKIERLLVEMRALEAAVGADVPLLVHSDLALVDSKLKPTGQRFWAQSGLSTVSAGQSGGGMEARRGLILQNFVTGCAVLGNAALRDRASPMPDGAHVHDWWVTLVAAFFGEVRGVSEPLVDYRQHSSNTIGAKSWDIVSVTRRFLAAPLRMRQKAVDTLGRLRAQARCFLDQYQMELADRERRALRDFADLADAGLIRRKTYMARHGVYPQTPLRRLIFFAMM